MIEPKEIFTDILKIILVIIIYISVLLLIAPLIDHAFSSLHKNETNFQILKEIILQLITISIVWYYLNKILLNMINKIINIKGLPRIEAIIGIVSGVTFVGLPKSFK